MLAHGVDHISFTVADLETSLHFYREILGFEVIPRPDFGIPGAWLRTGTSQVHLIAKPEDHESKEPGGRFTPLANHQAFAVADYQKTIDHLKSHGLEVMETSPEQGQLWVQDPDGNVIEFLIPRS